jgi:hypothetical protein
MSITIVNTQAQADAIPSPKMLWYDIGRIVIYTGADIPQISQDQQDRNDANQYAKLVALRQMTPAQIQTWVTNNVTNLAQAQDAIKTLAIAVSILARNL